jgi:hypothetical protein
VHIQCTVKLKVWQRAITSGGWVHRTIRVPGAGRHPTDTQLEAAAVLEPTAAISSTACYGDERPVAVRLAELGTATDGRQCSRSGPSADSPDVQSVVPVLIPRPVS